MFLLCQICQEIKAEFFSPILSMISKPYAICCFKTTSYSKNTTVFRKRVRLNDTECFIYLFRSWGGGLRSQNSFVCFTSWQRIRERRDAFGSTHSLSSSLNSVINRCDVFYCYNYTTNILNLLFLKITILLFSIYLSLIPLLF